MTRGVRQGSVLSPTLLIFLLVMDPLLQKLESSGLGLSVNGLFAGAVLHADDIRTMANSSESLEAQIRGPEVTVFAKQNYWC